MTNQSQVDQLVEEGIAAAKAGDKALARGKLEMAVKIDQYSEKAWFWLARVVETDEERRACLGNVLIINPQNQKAQQLLDKLENRAIAKENKGKRNPRLLIGGVIGLLVLCGIIFILMQGGGDDETALLPTEFSTQTQTPTPDVALSATAQILITPSDTPFVRPTNPPTWTPTPGPTNTPEAQTYPTPPTDIPGRIIMQSGKVTGDDDNQPIVIYRLSDGVSLPVSNEGLRGQNPVLAPGRDRFAYAQYLTGSRSLAIQLQNIGFPELIDITSLYPPAILLATPNYPAWSGDNLAFAAPEFGRGKHDIWLLEIGGVTAATAVPSFGQEQSPTPSATFTATASLTPEGFQPSPTPDGPTMTPTLPPSNLSRLTDNAADNIWPTFDPTGTALVYVQMLNGVTDLMVVNINSKAIFALTENGNQLIESAPDWGGNNEIVFSSAIQGSEDASDIYIMQADGSAEPTQLFDFGPQDIQPRFSPDGKYIVFSSNINGNWDVFIYNRETQEIYGVATNPDSIDIANDWSE